MNMVFTPKLEPMPERVIIRRDKSPITAIQIDELVRLRVLAVPYHDISARLGKSYTYWQKAVIKYRLERLIEVKRNSLIQGKHSESKNTHQSACNTCKPEERRNEPMHNGQNVQVQSILPPSAD